MGNTLYYAVIWSRQQKKFIIEEHLGYDYDSEKEYWGGIAAFLSTNKTEAEKRCVICNNSL